MSLFDLMADLLPGDQPKKGKADIPEQSQPCLNSVDERHDERHSEETESQAPVTPEAPPESCTGSASTTNARAKPEMTAQPTSVPTKAKIYTAQVDGKEITLIDTNGLPFEEFVRGVRGRFGRDRVKSIRGTESKDLLSL